MKITIVRSNNTEENDGNIAASESGLYSTPKMGSNTIKDKYVRGIEVSVHAPKPEQEKTNDKSKLKTVKDAIDDDDEPTDDDDIEI